jgi:hypothetical protein
MNEEQLSPKMLKSAETGIIDIAGATSGCFIERRNRAPKS